MTNIILCGGNGTRLWPISRTLMPKQHDEKLIPTIIRKALTGQNIPIYGDGKNERTNLQIVDSICSILDKKVPTSKSYKELITFVEDRAGHDRRYAIDATKLETELGWKANEDFESGIVKTVDWYLDKYNK